MTRKEKKPDVFFWPAVLGVVTAFGLISALLGDDVWDALSWAALVAPVFCIAYFWLNPKQRSR
jgi:hypothetical protein